jgi:hypothetical protein
MQTCRFCKGWHGEMVKYGVRHYAHHACYLDAGKTLEELHAWQIRDFPFRVLADRDLLNKAEKLVKADHKAIVVKSRAKPF